jgi:uncharacterized protein YbjT (DUF2867 family)
MSEKRTYAITAATGRIGRRVARSLLSAGHHVRALGRDSKKLAALADLGATVCVGDLMDRTYVEQAFEGADVAFQVNARDPSPLSFQP